MDKTNPTQKPLVRTDQASVDIAALGVIFFVCIILFGSSLVAHFRGYIPVEDVARDLIVIYLLGTLVAVLWMTSHRWLGIPRGH